MCPAQPSTIILARINTRSCWRIQCVARCSALIRDSGGSPYLVADKGVFADGVDATLVAVRENLKSGATQIKIMGGGGVMSDFDPIHTLQPSPAEIRAAVQDRRT